MRMPERTSPSTLWIRTWLRQSSVIYHFSFPQHPFRVVIVRYGATERAACIDRSRFALYWAKLHAPRTSYKLEQFLTCRFSYLNACMRRTRSVEAITTESSLPPTMLCVPDACRSHGTVPCAPVAENSSLTFDLSTWIYAAATQRMR